MVDQQNFFIGKRATWIVGKNHQDGLIIKKCSNAGYNSALKLIHGSVPD